MEPEIVDLAQFLNKMGARVYGAGTNLVRIVGVSKLKEVSYRIMPDRIEAGTILIAAAMAAGEVTITDVIPEHISPLISKLTEVGCRIDTDKREITIKAPNRLKATDIKTLPYPRFSYRFATNFFYNVNNSKRNISSYRKYI